MVGEGLVVARQESDLFHPCIHRASQNFCHILCPWWMFYKCVNELKIKLNQPPDISSHSRIHVSVPSKFSFGKQLSAPKPQTEYPQVQALVRVLISQGCSNRLGAFTQIHYLPVLEARVWNQGTGRAVTPLKALRKNLFLLVFASGDDWPPRHSLSWSCLTSVSASILTWPLTSVYVSVSILLL